MTTKIPVHKKLRAYKASDYAGLDIAGFHFYFGYEETICSKHKNPEECEEKYEDGCPYEEWAFVAKKNDKEIMRIGESALAKACGEEVEDPAHGLVLGLGMWIKKNA